VARAKKGKKKPKRRPDTALFICRCGSNIAGVIDVDALKERYEHQDLTLVDVDDHLCSEQGIRTLIDNIKKSKAKKVVVAGCSPHLHKDLFDDTIREAGIDPGHLQIANIREQCSWVHVDNPEAATAKAAAIIDTCLALVKGSFPIPMRKTAVTRRALIIGGGVAGLTTALRIADAGVETVIVEREGFLGGHMAKWDKLFPTFDCSICILGPVMTRVERHPLIRAITLTDIENIQGTPGSYTVTVNQHARFVDTETCTGCNKCLEVCPVEVADSYNYGLGKR
jgi:heterodisulfide reductase subunit A